MTAFSPLWFALDTCVAVTLAWIRTKEVIHPAEYTTEVLRLSATKLRHVADYNHHSTPCRCVLITTVRRPAAIKQPSQVCGVWPISSLVSTVARVSTFPWNYCVNLKFSKIRFLRLVAISVTYRFQSFFFCKQSSLPNYYYTKLMTLCQV